MTFRVLLADPDANRARDFLRRLAGTGYEVRDCRSLEDAGTLPPADLLLVHSDALARRGGAAVERWRGSSPGSEVLLLARPGPPQDGAFSETLSPTVETEVLLRTVRRYAEAAKVREDARLRYGFSALIGESRVMRAVLHVAGQVARSDAGAVMIRGESGSGKDLLARAIHFESARADRPFVTVMCTTLQDTLLESELFGYEKGAFTDAKARKCGVFEAADGGTVFLNEIGDMNPHLQAKLLQVLDEQAFRRVGGSQDVRVDVRVIAATNRDLEQAVREGRFRMDLFYRLNIFPIFLPPLRDRLEDVPLFVTHFLQRNAKKYGAGSTGSVRRRSPSSRPTAGRETSASSETSLSARARWEQGRRSRRRTCASGTWGLPLYPRGRSSYPKRESTWTRWRRASSPRLSNGPGGTSPRRPGSSGFPASASGTG